MKNFTVIKSQQLLDTEKNNSNPLYFEWFINISRL